MNAGHYFSTCFAECVTQVNFHESQSPFVVPHDPLIRIFLPNNVSGVPAGQN